MNLLADCSSGGLVQALNPCMVAEPPGCSSSWGRAAGHTAPVAAESWGLVLGAGQLLDFLPCVPGKSFPCLAPRPVRTT
jgi:hypothetical protein